jgi:hypothetical protein
MAEWKKEDMWLIFSLFCDNKIEKKIGIFLKGHVLAFLFQKPSKVCLRSGLSSWLVTHKSMRRRLRVQILFVY